MYDTGAENMNNNDDMKKKIGKAVRKNALYGKNIDLHKFTGVASKHNYVNDIGEIEKGKTHQMKSIGMDVCAINRAGTYVQIDHSVVNCNTDKYGLEIMDIENAMKEYSWLTEYFWKAVAPDNDKYTAMTYLEPKHGYFIRALKNAKISEPVQACLYISDENLIQDVHNVIIIEEGAELNVITGCATDSKVEQGMHIGVSEFYVKKGGKLSFTMIHNWGEKVAVRPRTTVIVEEDATYISNYICLNKVADLQMYPTAKLIGRGAVVRMNSVLVAATGTNMDVGSRVILEAPETKAEIIARTISTGGIVINRGHLIGKASESKAHLECHGLLLSDEGLIHAIPELESESSDAELSHEAAVGKIAPEEIEYLMSRGLTEEEAIATIVRGFLNVNIEGLPESLKAEIDKVIQSFNLNKGI